jgi:DNA-nicking Smr family endonuclease
MIDSKLDLHGTKHKEARRILENFIYQHIRRGTKEVEIITGNSPEMKKIVSDIAKEYDMTTRECWGNFGCLMLNMT